MLIQDWLTLKVIYAKEKNVTNIKHGEKLVYLKEWKKYIWTYVWYNCNYDYEVKFLYKLSDKQLERFNYLDKKAKDIFYNVKNDLKIVFPMLKFINAKMNYTWDTIYLYFFSEDRIDFRDWLSDLRQLIGMNFFLYQVWARDRIRLHPDSINMCWDCWNNLCCVRTMEKLESVKTSTINLQNLQTQWIDKQKWLCWKLKCCLKYEEEIYEKEIVNYPEIWTKLEKDWKIYTVIGVNVILKYVFLKDDDWYIIRLPIKNI